MNIAPMDPHSHDSDLDGMPDGWEFAYGLDPTDPFDGSRDNDADGVSIGVGIGLDLTDTGVIWKNIASQLPPNTDTMAQIPEFQTLMETV